MENYEKKLTFFFLISPSLPFKNKWGEEVFFISPPRLPFPVIFSSPALIPSSPLAHLITILYRILYTTPPLIHALPLSIGTLSIPRPPFSFPSHTYNLQHSSFQLPSSIHSLFTPPFISPHPCQTKAQRNPKTRTMHKSINPPLHFYRFTFLRFYTFTENSQRKIHHPTPLDKHWSVNNPASYPGKDY